MWKSIYLPSLKTGPAWQDFRLVGRADPAFGPAVDIS